VNKAARRQFIASVGKGVIARYDNFYRGDSDFFTHCLIMKTGECWLPGQGLEQVLLHTFKANAAKFRQLKTALASIPAAWSKASHGGYNLSPTPKGRTRERLPFTAGSPADHWLATSCRQPVRRSRPSSKPSPTSTSSVWRPENRNIAQLTS
jgi:hypothetical protein